MAKPKLVTYFKTTLEDKPGTLAALTKDLKAKSLGLVALWGYGTEPGQGTFYCIPKSPEKFRAALKGTTLEEGTGLLLKGADKTGALVKTLEAIAGAGVNILGVHAIGAGANFASFIRVAAADVEKTGKALGIK